MNRLLKKFLFEINALPTRITEAMPTPKPTEENPETGLPAGLYQRGSSYYSNPRGGRENYVGKIIDGKFVYAQDQSASSPTGTREPSASGDADQARDDGSTASAFKGTFKSKVHMLSPLVDAINSGDVGEIRAQMERLGIVRDADGKLKSTMKGVGYGFFGKSEEALRATKELEAVLAPLGITIPDEKELEISTTSADALKPQNIKQGTKKAEIKAIRDKNGKVSGFGASGRTYEMIPRAPNLVTRLVEASKPRSIVEVFKARGMGDAEAKAEAEVVDTAIASHNTKITMLANEAEKTKDAFLEVTDRAIFAQELVSIVIESAGSNLSDEQKSVISDMLIRLSKADTTEEFDAEWSGDFSAPRQRGTQRKAGDREILLQVLMRAGLTPNAIPALCESVEILRKSTGNATVLIPRRQNFELVDIVVLREPVKTGLESIEDIDRLNNDIVQQLQLVNVQVELLGVKSGGTKGSGRASAAQTRVLLTEFDSNDTKRDLISLVGTEAHMKLWDCKDEDEFVAYSKNKLTLLAPYMDDIISYYGLAQQVEGKTEEETLTIVMATLASGTFPQYDRNGNFVGVGPDASLFNNPDITDLNRKQMRLYSFLGFASDAIYNMRARRQGFTNATYSVLGIKESDGKAQMARSVFQFSRDPMEKKNAHGVVVLRPSYSYTSNLENTDSGAGMQSFAARKKRGEVNEVLLLEKKNTAGAPPSDMPPTEYKARGGGVKWKATRNGNTEHGFNTKEEAQAWYDAEGKKPSSQAGSVATANTPPEKQRTPRTTAQQPSSAPALPVEQPDETPKYLQGKSAPMVGIIGDASVVPIKAPDGSTVEVSMRHVLDKKGNPIDASTKEGRDMASNLLAQRLERLKATTKRALRDFGRNKQATQWIADIGEMQALKELLDSGVEAYMTPASNPESDLVMINRDTPKGLKIVEISAKSTKQSDKKLNVGARGANARAPFLKMAEGKQTTIDGISSPVSAKSAIGVVYDIREVLGYMLTNGRVVEVIGQREREMNLSDEELAKCTPEYRTAYENSRNIQGSSVRSNLALYEKNRIISKEDVDQLKEKMLSKVLENKKTSDEEKETERNLIEHYTTRLHERIVGHPLSSLQEILMDDIGEIFDNTDPPSDVVLDSDLVVIRFDKRTGIPEVKVAKWEDVKRCIDGKQKSVANTSVAQAFPDREVSPELADKSVGDVIDDACIRPNGTMKWKCQIKKYMRVTFPSQARLSAAKAGKARTGKLQLKANWAPPLECTEENLQDTSEYVRKQ